MRWRTLLLLLILVGCVTGLPQPGEQYSARVFAVVTMDRLSPRSAVANALQAATLDDVWDRRLVAVNCVLSPNAPPHQVHRELRLALAPPGMTDLVQGDYVAISKGALTGEAGPVSRILHRLAAPRPEELVKYSGVVPMVLCQESNDHVLQVRVVRFVEPLEAIEASLQIRDPMRGLDATDVRDGRIVMLECSRGEETDPLFWYARLADGVAARQGDQVEALAGVPESNWNGGDSGPFSGKSRASVEAAGAAHWPIRLSSVVRVVGPLPESEVSYRGIPFCRDRNE